MSEFLCKFLSPLPRSLALSYDRIGSSILPHFYNLRAKSPTAAHLIFAIQSDQSGNIYSFVEDIVSEQHGCALTTAKTYDTRPRYRQILCTHETPSLHVMIRIDLRCKVQFTDVNGQSFTPSIERILAHELGHMYLYVGRKNMADKADYHKAIDYENIIARELDPEAPIRSVKDHGDPDAWLKKF